ncbi:unnamed protein product [Calypogeia fissa]
MEVPPQVGAPKPTTVASLATSTNGSAAVFVPQLGACGVAVTSYNSGASDIRDSEAFKEALENQVEEVELKEAAEKGKSPYRAIMKLDEHHQLKD